MLTFVCMLYPRFIHGVFSASQTYGCTIKPKSVVRPNLEDY